MLQSGEVDGVCADATANLQHLLAPPALKLGKPRDMWFHEVFAGFHFIKVFPRSDRFGRMTDVAGTAVPRSPAPLQWPPDGTPPPPGAS